MSEACDLSNPVKSVLEYLKVIQHLRNAWNLRNSDEMWFRGEPHEYQTSLRPALYRPSAPFSRLKSLESVIYQEYQQFRLFQHEAEQFREKASYQLDKDWDDYFLMQHHGAPTRLLDWTVLPLVALYFALQTTDQSCSPRVYVLEWDRMQDKLKDSVAEDKHLRDWQKHITEDRCTQYNWNEWEMAYLPMEDTVRNKLPMPKMPLILEYDHYSRRINAQGSRFVIFGTEVDSLALELKRNSQDRAIEQILIDESSIDAISDELANYGTTPVLIFPDLDGVGKLIKDNWKRWNKSDY